MYIKEYYFKILMSEVQMFVIGKPNWGGANQKTEEVTGDTTKKQEYIIISRLIRTTFEHTWP